MISLAAGFIKIKNNLLEQIQASNSQLTVETVKWLPTSQLCDAKSKGPAFLSISTGKLFLAAKN